MFHRLTRVAVGAAVVITTTAAALAVPSAAQAADRHRSESGHNSNPSKTTTAECDPGDVLIGAGARIMDGGGGVSLAAMVPGANSVTARGEALAGYDEPWSVVALAVCRPASQGTPVIVDSAADSLTATCPGGTYLSGTGFDLPAGSVLTGLVPTSGMSVTVRSAQVSTGSGDPVAYAVCVPEYGFPFFSMTFSDSGLYATAPTRSQTVVRDTLLSGVGGEITFSVGAGGPAPVNLSVVFINAMYPSADLTSVKVDAVSTSPFVHVPLWPAPGVRAQLEAGPTWSLTADGIAPDYYYF